MSDTLPDLHAIAEEILGLPYAQYDCWGVLRHCFSLGWGITFDPNPTAALVHVVEVWWQDDPRDPLMLMQPWDVVIYRTTGPASRHVGIVMDTERFLHTRRSVGVCLEPLRRWSSRLIQLARLRQLLA
jgi:cell wall-associated NlpC family hydrolase